MSRNGNLVRPTGNDPFEDRTMMTCREFIEFLHEYLGGDLPPEQKARFEDHLAVCVSCVNYLSNYKDTVRLAKASLAESDEPVPADVPEELIAAILAARKTGGG